MANTRTSTSRKPRTAARAASRPATTRRAVEPEGEFDDEQETTAAEAQEIEAEGHYVTALLADEEIRVVPPGAWRQSWQSMLGRGLFTAFAEKIIHPDDLDLYFEIDPTNDEFEAFVETAASRSGEGLGKSRGRAASSKSTRRR